MRRSTLCTHALLGAALGLAPLALAQEDASLIERLGGQPAGQGLDTAGRSSIQSVTAEPIADETTVGVSAVFGAAYNTHFVSYGFDVWAAGTEFGTNATFNPTIDLAFDLGNGFLPDGFAPLTAGFGIWADVNDNAPDSIGGDLQEVDFYYSLGSGYGDFGFSVTYQNWLFAGGVEEVLDIAVSYDDSALWGGNFALSPSFLAHRRLAASQDPITDADGNITVGDNGWIFLLGIEPAFDIIDSEAFPMSLSIPVTVAFSDGEFYDEAGFAYVSVGAQFAFPIPENIISSDYGEWSVSAGITGFFTDEEVIPENPDDAFLTGNVGISLAF